MTTPPARNPLRDLRISDVQGMAQLATQATTGVTRIVEGVHRSVWDTIGIPGGKAPGQTRGITGLVYRIVHGVTSLVGKGVDTALAGLKPLLESTGAKPGTPRREALLAALNGVMGDRLVDSGNPLAAPMTLRYRSATLNWQDLPPMPEATGKVLVLIHGLCMSDLRTYAQHRSSVRLRRGEEPVVDHGEALASALDYTPVYLRYNSGLHTSQNGRELAAQLEQLVAHWPTEIEELTVVAHSMGGLLIRSAYHYAKQDALRWTGHLKNIVFLGTPHYGSPLERVGNRVDVILGSTPYTAPFARLGQVRSVGITDLRYGNLLDEDWGGHDRPPGGGPAEKSRRRPDSRPVVPLPEGVACYTVAATTTAERNDLANRLIGDGLVPLFSALGEHDDARRNLGFAQESQWIACRMNHMELLSSPEVTRRIVRWLTSARRGGATASGSAECDESRPAVR